MRRVEGNTKKEQGEVVVGNGEARGERLWRKPYPTTNTTGTWRLKDGKRGGR